MEEARHRATHERHDRCPPPTAPGNVSQHAHRSHQRETQRPVRDARCGAVLSELCCQSHPEQSEPGRHRTKRRGAHERQNSPTHAIGYQAPAAHPFRPPTPRTDNVHYVIPAAGAALPTEPLS